MPRSKVWTGRQARLQREHEEVLDRMQSSEIDTEAKVRGELLSLLAFDDYDDDFVHPTSEAVEEMTRLIAGVRDVLGDEMPDGSPSTLGDGGLRFTFGRSPFRVTLVMDSEARDGYIYYYHDEDDHDAIREPTIEALVVQLRWLASFEGERSDDAQAE